MREAQVVVLGGAQTGFLESGSDAFNAFFAIPGKSVNNERLGYDLEDGGTRIE